jgi:hypothetical protein
VLSTVPCPSNRPTLAASVTVVRKMPDALSGSAPTRFMESGTRTPALPALRLRFDGSGVSGSRDHVASSVKLSGASSGRFRIRSHNWENTPQDSEGRDARPGGFNGARGLSLL